ncbi:hypothetical protein PMAYCL1PPCAC_31776, partial [Pristionchus mayeri]
VHHEGVRARGIATEHTARGDDVSSGRDHLGVRERAVSQSLHVEQHLVGDSCKTGVVGVILRVAIDGVVDLCESEVYENVRACAHLQVAV